MLGDGTWKEKKINNAHSVSKINKKDWSIYRIVEYLFEVGHVLVFS